MKRYYPAICTHCGGKGFVNNTNPSITSTIETCPVCDGKRRITVMEEISEGLPDLKRHSTELGDIVYTFETTSKKS